MNEHSTERTDEDPNALTPLPGEPGIPDVNERQRLTVSKKGLLALGLTMEVSQFMMQAGRTADPYDMAANTGGIAAGVVLAWFATGGWAEKLETWLES